jgi:hypothetical protein
MLRQLIHRTTTEELERYKRVLTTECDSFLKSAALFGIETELASREREKLFVFQTSQTKERE